MLLLTFSAPRTSLSSSTGSWWPRFPWRSLPQVGMSTALSSPASSALLLSPSCCLDWSRSFLAGTVRWRNFRGHLKEQHQNTPTEAQDMPPPGPVRRNRSFGQEGEIPGDSQTDPLQHCNPVHLCPRPLQICPLESTHFGGGLRKPSRKEGRIY